MRYTRIGIIGAMNSGRSTFIRTIATDGVQGEMKVSYGEVRKGDFRIVFMVNDLEMLVHDFLVEISLEGTHGVLFMVDSTAGEILNAVKACIELHMLYLSPEAIIIVANKQDHPLAYSVSAIRQALETDLTIVPCVATRKALVQETIDILLSQLAR